MLIYNKYLNKTTKIEYNPIVGNKAEKYSEALDRLFYIIKSPKELINIAKESQKKDTELLKLK